MGGPQGDSVVSAVELQLCSCLLHSFNAPLFVFISDVMPLNVEVFMFSWFLNGVTDV